MGGVKDDAVNGFEIPIAVRKPLQALQGRIVFCGLGTQGSVAARRVALPWAVIGPARWA